LKNGSKPGDPPVLSGSAKTQTKKTKKNKGAPSGGKQEKLQVCRDVIVLH